MPYLWSNPNQQGATPAQLTAGAHINEINMGPVVTAILEHQRQQQQQQAAYQQQIAQGIQYLSKQYEAGQADDAANSAMYQSKYPGDNPSYEGYQDRVPDYGGTNALKAQSLMEQLGGGSPLEQGLLKQKILAEAALAHQRLMPPRSSGVSANQEAVQQRFEERQALGDLNQQIKDLNLTGGLTDAHGAHITRDTLDSSEQVHKGTGPGGEYIPEGYYGIGGSKLDTVVPAGEFDKAHSAMNKYNEMLQRPSKQSSSSGESLPVAEAFSQAKAAIAAGADREAVLQRLQDAGYNTDNF